MTKGMIHTISWDASRIEQGKHMALDFSRKLTENLQQMVRQGSIFKLVGLDINVLTDRTLTDLPEGSVSGQILYYQPTLGRCQAWRSAFFAAAKARKLQGIPYNYNYDFRLGFDAGSAGDGRIDFGDYPIANQAWLEYYEDDGTEAAFQGLFLTNTQAQDSQQSIFDVHNLGIQFVPASTAKFGGGWSPYNPVDSDSYLTASKRDYVKNEAALLTTDPRGKVKYAQTRMEKIGFQVSYSQDDDKGNTSGVFQWRPVANEYLPVMCGLMEVVFTDTMQEDDKQSITVSAYIAGWKPILRRKSRKKK